MILTGKRTTIVHKRNGETEIINDDWNTADHPDSIRLLVDWYDRLPKKTETNSSTDDKENSNFSQANYTATVSNSTD